MRSFASLALAVILVTACGSGGQPEGTTPPSPAEREVTTTVIPAGTPTTTDDITVHGNVVDAAVAQAAADTGLNQDRLEVMTAHRVVWSDASLGCPEEGLSYAQMLTDGYWVVLDSPRGNLDYRSSLSLDFRRCLDGRDPQEILDGN